MTVQELIRKCELKDAGNGMISSTNPKVAKKHIDEIKARKAEILACIQNERAAAETARKEYQAKIDGIEGLKALRAALGAAEGYQRAFTRMMEDEHNDGINPPTKPVTNPADLKDRYPRAAAYLKAEAWECAAHFAKSGAGRRAKERIINGEDCATVLAEMETEWEAHCKEEAWR